MRTQYFVSIAYLLSLLLPTASAYGEGALPSDIITQAIKENRTILQIRGTPVTDKVLEQWVLFFNESERRKLNLATAQVVKVLRKGRSAGIRPGQSLLVSEATNLTYSLPHEHNGIPMDDEHPIESAASLEQGAQYLYIVDQVQTVKKKRGKDKASFSIARELNRKGIFKIVSDEKAREMVPTITTAELKDLMPLFSNQTVKGRSKIQAMSAAAPQTKLGARVAKKLEPTAAAAK